MSQTHATHTAAVASGPPPPYTKHAAGLKPIPIFTSLEITDPVLARKFDRFNMPYTGKTKLINLIKTLKYVVANKHKLEKNGKSFCCLNQLCP